MIGPYAPFMALGAILAALGLVLLVVVYIGNRRARRAAWRHDAACGNTKHSGPDNAPSPHDIDGRVR